MQLRIFFFSTGQTHSTTIAPPVTTDTKLSEMFPRVLLFRKGLCIAWIYRYHLLIAADQIELKGEWFSLLLVVVVCTFGHVYSICASFTLSIQCFCFTARCQAFFLIVPIEDRTAGICPLASHPSISVPQIMTAHGAKPPRLEYGS